jgi:PKD repeat protein
MSACQTDEVDTPPLTGLSGHRLFLTMDASPDHLVIKSSGKPRASSRITTQLKNQLGQGVGNVSIKFRITNDEGGEVNIGSLSQLQGSTDAGGFARVTYTAPNLAEQPVPTRIYIIAIMRDPAYTFEVTAKHALDLEAARPPIDCAGSGPGAPDPAFTITPSTGTVDEPSCFDAQATTDNGTIVAFSWSFGDGGVASGVNVCHTFDEEGLYNVTLVVQDEDRNCSSITQVYEVGTGTSATCSISVSPQNPPLGTPVNLIATITDDRTVVSFNWNFGDGKSTTTSGNTVSHNYGSEGSFTVTLTITDSQGNVSTCTATVTVGSLAPTCAFAFSPTAPKVDDSVLFTSLSTDPDGVIESFSWQFGDGGSSTSANPSHIYTAAASFIAILTVTDDQGNVTSCSQTIAVTLGEPPDCDLIASPTPANIGETVSFNASGSTDSDGTITNFTFDFGDGGSLDNGSDPTTSHAYTTAGSKTATVTVTDNDGNRTTCSVIVIVGTGAPTCSFSISPTVNITPLQTVSVNASASADPDGGAITFAWSFPGGVNTTAPATEVTEDVTYANPGTFTITLVVTDNEAQSTSCSNPVTIGNTLPVCAFSVLGINQSTGLASFDASASVDPDGGAITLFSWAFGDALSFSSTSPTTTHTYATTGDRTVTLTVTDNEGTTSQCTQQANFTGLAPTASFTAASQVCINGSGDGTVNFNASASTDNDEGGASIEEFLWDFGDGSVAVPSVSPNISHIYTIAGVTRLVTLTVTDDEGDTDVFQLNVDVRATPGITNVTDTGGANTFCDGIVTITGTNFLGSTTLVYAPGGSDVVFTIGSNTSITDSSPITDVVAQTVAVTNACGTSSAVACQ